MTAPKVTRMTSYPDTGCALHESCLRCPRPRCVFDDPPVATERGKRDERIRELARDGASPTVIALHLHLSRRAVVRVLAVAV